MASNYDEASQQMTFTCPVCDRSSDYDLSSAKVDKHHPTERFFWSMSIGACPGCGSEHFLNLNLPDDHPDQAAKHINKMLAQKEGKAAEDLPRASVPAAQQKPKDV